MLDIILNIVGVLAIIVFGAFLVVLVADLILSAFDKHEGVFFHRQKRSKKGREGKVFDYEPENTVEVYDNIEQTNIIDEEKVQEERKQLEQYVAPTPVITTLAEEEARLNPEPIVEEKTEIVSTFDNNSEEIIDEEEIEDDEESDEYDCMKIFEEVSKQADALLERRKKDDELNSLIARVKDKVVSEIKTEETLNIVQTPVEQVVETKEEIVEEPVQEKTVIKVVKVDSSNEVKKLRNLRKKILSDKAEEEKEESKLQKEMEERLKELEELKKFKEESESHIAKLAEEVNKKEKAHEEERAKLLKEVETLKTREEGKPYFTEEYYQNKYERLSAELKEAEKDLRANKKEFIPLQKVKKAYDKDGDKLRKKEMAVAKQKISLYGMGSTAKSIDPIKKEKLDEEVKMLNELKDSVFSCEQVLKQNKDRYPALEKTNKVLTKQVEKLKSDIASTNEALAWYKENSKKKPADTDKK